MELAARRGAPCLPPAAPVPRPVHSPARVGVRLACCPRRACGRVSVGGVAAAASAVREVQAAARAAGRIEGPPPAPHPTGRADAAGGPCPGAAACEAGAGHAAHPQRGGADGGVVRVHPCVRRPSPRPPCCHAPGGLPLGPLPQGGCPAALASVGAADSPHADRPAACCRPLPAQLRGQGDERVGGLRGCAPGEAGRQVRRHPALAAAPASLCASPLARVGVAASPACVGGGHRGRPAAAAVLRPVAAVPTASSRPQGRAGVGWQPLAPPLPAPSAAPHARRGTGCHTGAAPAGSGGGCLHARHAAPRVHHLGAQC